MSDLDATPDAIGGVPTSRPLTAAKPSTRRAIVLHGEVVLEYDLADTSPRGLAMWRAGVILATDRETKVIDGYGRQFDDRVVVARAQALAARQRPDSKI